MAKVDLDRLETALKTGDSKFYHGDINEGMLEALAELREAREQLEEIRDIIGASSLVIKPT